MGAAVELHQRDGPLATTITAIAERAGVERLTVYRHFPDEPSLHAACTAHYFAHNPPPDPERWRKRRDPEERLRTALEELYEFWRRTEPMMSSVLRDYEVDPERAGGGAVAFMARARDALLPGWSLRGRARTRLVAAIGHAVHFRTWRSLVGDGELTTAEAVEQMSEYVLLVAGRRARP